jgi:succinate dehydrogenase/fumarate reductase flavoprotein subunit
MTMVDDFHFSTDFHNPPYVEFLQKECKSAVQWFEGLPFHQWADKKSYAKGPGGHPLEQAHQSAFDYCKNYYTTLLS